MQGLSNLPDHIYFFCLFYLTIINSPPNSKLWNNPTWKADSGKWLSYSTFRREALLLEGMSIYLWNGWLTHLMPCKGIRTLYVKQTLGVKRFSILFINIFMSFMKLHAVQCTPNEKQGSMQDWISLLLAGVSYIIYNTGGSDCNS